MFSEIINGGVYFKNNDRLCYVHTIQWDDLQQDLEPVILTTENHADCKNRSEYATKFLKLKDSINL